MSAHPFTTIRHAAASPSDSAIADRVEGWFDDAPDDTVRRLRAGRFRLVQAPTPLQPLDRLRAALGGEGPRLWIKRDDLTGLALGGNKARKLEYLLAEATDAGADVVVTVGAAQSNHARQTAAAAATAGLDAVLVLRIPRGSTAESVRSGNVLLDRVFGARLVLVEETEHDPHPERAAAEAVVAALRAEGRRPFLIPSGGSTPVGALGYVDAFAEIAAAPVRFDAIVVASGSGGTQAGLLAGRALLSNDPGEPRPRIDGVAVSPGAAEFAREVHALADATLALLGASGVAATDVRVDADHVGPAYGIPTPGAIEAIGLFARTEGILLDPVYTGKAAAALIDGIRRRHSEDRDVLFLHTGGAPALFAHEPVLTAAFGG